MNTRFIKGSVPILILEGRRNYAANQFRGSRNKPTREFGSEFGLVQRQSKIKRESVPPAEDVSTLEGLTLRRLHMYRAKLKSSATTSQLLCGFAMTAAAELQTNSPDETEVPQWLWISYVLCTTLLVSVHAFAIMISTYILPNIDVVTTLHSSSYLTECSDNKLMKFVEVAWLFSNLFGLFLFLIELGLLCWVKFWDFSFNSAIAATVVVIPAMLILLLFVAYSYLTLTKGKIKSTLNNVNSLESIRKELDIVF